MIGYKLFRKRRDGTLSPLFIDRKRVLIPGGCWYAAENVPTKGYAIRPGWHICKEKRAPHLKKSEDRVWALVQFINHKEHKRPESQGGIWYTAELMRILKVIG
jgi:hypothetical protein